RGGGAARGRGGWGWSRGRGAVGGGGRGAISPAMGIGRGMKVGKEEIVGLLAAVERFVALDHDAEWRSWEARTSHLVAELSKVPGVAARREVPEIANRFPQVVVEWSRWHAAPAAAEVIRRLSNRHP